VAFGFSYSAFRERAPQKHDMRQGSFGRPFQQLGQP
jgi:hypothetical protein